MKSTLAITTIVALSVTLGACSSNQLATPTATPAVTASATPAPALTPAPASTPPATSTPAPSPAQSPAVTAKSYHMNKVYDIVPNDANGNKKVVLLTFDDGPKEHDMLESIITTLEKHKAKAIFFMNGYRIKEHPELLKLIDSRGQTLGNHSWDHIDLKKEKPEKVEQQISDVQKIIKDTTGKAPQFFRPPFGSGNDHVKETAKKHEMLYMTWSNGSLDWEMNNKKNDPNQVVTNVIKQLHPGANILMHELPWTASALDKLLTELEKQGYGFVDPQSIELEMR